MNTEFHLNKSEPRLFSFCKFDKKFKLPFVYTQYIKFHSNEAIHQAYNIVVPTNILHLKFRLSCY